MSAPTLEDMVITVEDMVKYQWRTWSLDTVRTWTFKTVEDMDI